MIAAGIILVVLAAIIVPVAGMFMAQSEDTDGALTELAAYRAKIAAEPRLRAMAAGVAQQETQAGMLIAGGSTALAAANMQNAILDIVQRHGGQVRSSQTVTSPAAAAGGLACIVVQYEVSLPPGSLLGATYELETRAPYLFIDTAEIRPELYGDGTAPAPNALHVSWTVHAYRRADAP
jgi:hypothetical protein